jgi:glycosyltransferase involved in cell wall biosynthesis
MRLRLLLIAPTVDGTDVGEAWVAHQWVKRLAERHDVTLLTYTKRGRPPASGQLSGCRVIEWNEPPLLGRAERFNSLLKPGYLPFARHARQWVTAALARGERFDIAHQLTPVAMRYPCPVATLSIPYVIGPVGGSLPSPAGFTDDDSSPWYVSLRSIDTFRLRRDPWLRRTYEQAACVLGIAPYVGDHLSGLDIKRFEVLSETGIDELPLAPVRSDHGGPLRLLYVGRVVRTKGLRDVIRAISMLPANVDVTLDAVGDGPDLERCQQLAAELGIDDRIAFRGRQERRDVDAFYRNADVFVFPSYREPGGNVAFEAMTFCLPLIVSDIGGPGAAVDDSCGFRLHPTEPAAFGGEIAAAITTLATDPTRRLAMGSAARQRVIDVGLWDSKIGWIERLYAELISSN